MLETTHYVQRAALKTKIIDGEGTFIHPTTIVQGRVTFGKNVYVDAMCFIGMIPQCVVPREHPDYLATLHSREYFGEIIIGDNTIIRPMTTIEMPWRKGETPKSRGVTSIGKNCYIMANCNITHDCNIEDRVIISTPSALGGFTHIMHDAYLGGGTLIHPGTTIGVESITAGGSKVVRDIPPYVMYLDGWAKRFNFRNGTNGEVDSLKAFYKDNAGGAQLRHSASTNACR